MSAMYSEKTMLSAVGLSSCVKALLMLSRLFKSGVSFFCTLSISSSSFSRSLTFLSVAFSTLILSFCVSLIYFFCRFLFILCGCYG